MKCAAHGTHPANSYPNWRVEHAGRTPTPTYDAHTPIHLADWSTCCPMCSSNVKAAKLVQPMVGDNKLSAFGSRKHRDAGWQSEAADAELSDHLKRQAVEYHDAPG
mmetsp:Transcript_13619/g.41447  ORF Transcript_13619/g.41447 Transcript_13619/m.41447 type:complete len:106 (-) Transcript_13619:779-1096(-)